MAIFNYSAVNKSGDHVKGKITATSPMDLEAKVKETGCDLIDYKIETVRKSGLFSKIKAKDMIMFCVHMQELDRAGVSVIDSLVDMRDTVENSKMRDILSDLTEYIKGGESLSQALHRRSDVFDKLFVGLIAAGEETGNIGDAFGHLSSHVKWNNDFKRKIKKAISYPIVLMVVMTAVVTLMMLFVVPQLVDFLQKQGFDLPFYTLALIKTSAFFEEYWWAVIAGIPAFFISFLLVYKRVTSFKRAMDKIFLRLPGVGQIILKINLARFVKFFSITFSSGLGVLESLEISRKVVSNLVLQESVEEIMQRISEGARITEAFTEAGTFPSLVVRMFKVGEDSGNMSRSLENINFFYEREIDDAVEAMVGMIQPALLVVMGGTLMWIIAAVFGPVYGSFSQMNF